jgi:hypothetical protein
MSLDSPAGPETIKREASETFVSLPSRQIGGVRQVVLEIPLPLVKS